VVGKKGFGFLRGISQMLDAAPTNSGHAAGHEFWAHGEVRSAVLSRAARRCHLGDARFSCLCEGNRRSMRPVKGAPLRGRAALALDRPTRRLGDGYKEMG